MPSNIFGKNFKVVFLAIVILEMISFWSQQFTWLNTAVFIAILAVTLYVALIKIDYGLYVVLAELFIGSKGYLFYLDLGDNRLSIRIGLFLVIMAVWLINLFKKKSMTFFNKNNSYLYYYLILGVFITVGLVNGLSRQSFNDIFFDFNGWLFFAYLPVLFDAFNFRQFIKNILAVIFAAAGYLSLKTIALLLIFAHQFTLPLAIIYKWVRNSGVGEITYVSGNFYRIFMQSQIYVLIGLLIALTLILFSKKIELLKADVKWLYYISILSSMAILASLSRSFWVGLFASLIILLLYYAIYIRPRLMVFLKLIICLMLIIAAEAVFLNIITLNFSASLIKNRLNDPASEAAVSSRMAQLRPLWQAIKNEPMLGSGFGQTVTYVSDDPRIRQQSPDGKYTTFAFEWGYLDIWLKIGLLGLLSYLLVLGKVFSDAQTIIKRKSSYAGLVLGLALGLVALIATSIFSPYLNHPLGIGYLIIVSATVYALKNYGTESEKIGSQPGNL